MHAIPIHTKQKHTHFITAIQKNSNILKFILFDYCHRFKTDFVNFTILLSVYMWLSMGKKYKLVFQDLPLLVFTYYAFHACF